MNYLANKIKNFNKMKTLLKQYYLTKVMQKNKSMNIHTNIKEIESVI